MSIETLLSRLEKVRKRGGGQYMACCPVHQEKTPSLSIKDDNGTIIMMCFSCGAKGPEIIKAVGMEVSDLFPPRSDDYQTPKKRVYFPADQVLEALIMESTVVYMIASDMAHGQKIDEQTKERLLKAVSRIHAATSYTRI